MKKIGFRKGLLSTLNFFRFTEGQCVMRNLVNIYDRFSEKKQLTR